MLCYIQAIGIILLICSLIGYIYEVLKEKSYLKNNIIVVDKKGVTHEHINEVDIKVFIFHGLQVKTGDEVKVVLKEKKTYNGILIGIKKQNNKLVIVTHRNEIECIDIKNISKYGKILNSI